MYIVQGDHGIPIPFTVQKLTASENIEGATVEVAIHRGEDVFTKAATILNAEKGECEFVLTSSDLTLFAKYEWQWTAYFPDGRIFSGKKREFFVSERLMAGVAGGETVPVIVPFARVEELEALEGELEALQQYVDGLVISGGGSVVQDSLLNGNIKVNDAEVIVYDESAIIARIEALELTGGSTVEDNTTNGYITVNGAPIQVYDDAGKADVNHTHTELHSHSNKPTLDKLSDDGTNLLFNGTALSGGIGGGTAASSVSARTIMNNQLKPIDLRYYINTNDLANKPIISFIDDDGCIGAYTKLYPMFEARGIKFTSAIVGSFVGRQNAAVIGGNFSFMNESQIEELYNKGYEFVNHTYTHPNYTQVTPDVWETSIKLNSEWLIQRGYSWDIFVNPNEVGYDDTAINIMKKYTSIAFNKRGYNTQSSLNPFTLERQAFGQYTGASGNETLSYYTNLVDQCIANNGWLVWMLHVDQQTAAHDTILPQLLDYIISRNVPIVTAGEGYRIKGDKLRVNDTAILDRKGQIVIPSNVIQPKTLTKNTLTNDSLPSDFSEGVTYQEVDTTTGYPVSGVLKIEKFNGIVTQSLTDKASNDTYGRRNNGTNAWLTWVSGGGTPQNIPLTGLGLTNTSVAQNKNVKLTVTYSPSNTTERNVTFTSSNTSIATVDSTGTVTGIGVGTCTITVTSVTNNTISATCTLTVTEGVNYVSSGLAINFDFNRYATGSLSTASNIEFGDNLTNKFKVQDITNPVIVNRIGAGATSSRNMLYSTDTVMAKITSSTPATYTLSDFNVTVIVEPTSFYAGSDDADRIFNIGSNTTNDRLTINLAKGNFKIYHNGTITQVAPISANTRYTLAVNFDNAAKTITPYINGVAQTTFATTATLTTKNITISGYGNVPVNHNLKGYMYNAMVYNRKLTDVENQQNADYAQAF